MNAVKSALQAIGRDLIGWAVYSESGHSDATEGARKAAALVEPPVTDEQAADADSLWGVL